MKHKKVNKVNIQVPGCAMPMMRRIPRSNSAIIPVVTKDDMSRPMAMDKPISPGWNNLSAPAKTRKHPRNDNR